MLRMPGHKSPNGSGIFIRESGATREISAEEWNRRNPDRPAVRVAYNEEATDEVYSSNITHNLNKMAEAAGIYSALWTPDLVGIEKAVQLIAPLAEGLTTLLGDPDGFKKLDPPNGWGDYGLLVEFTRAYLKACIDYPDATVSVSR